MKYSYKNLLTFINIPNYIKMLQPFFKKIASLSLKLCPQSSSDNKI